MAPVIGIDFDNTIIRYDELMYETALANHWISEGFSKDKTAIREVEEETGVKGLKITKPLEMTYHIFKRNGRHKIKVTYWFEMYTDFEGELIPQEKEGITKVEWLSRPQIDIAMNNSYANIKLLM